MSSQGKEVFTYTELCDYLATLVEEKAKKIQEQAEQVVKEEAEKTKTQLVRDTPVSRFNRVHLKDTYKTEVQYKSIGKGKNKELRKKYVIYSESKYRVLHFVELGFNHKKGKRFIKGKHFVYKAKIDASERIENRIRSILNSLKQN